MALEWPLAGIAGRAADRALYTLLTAYYALRWRRHGWSRADIRQAYRRDRQAVLGGGFGRCVADSLRRLLRKRLAGEGPAGEKLAADVEADLDRLLPPPDSPAGAAAPFPEVFASHYGRAEEGGRPHG